MKSLLNPLAQKALCFLPLLLFNLLWAQAQNPLPKVDKSKIVEACTEFAEYLQISCSDFGSTDLQLDIQWDLLEKDAAIDLVKVPLTVKWKGKITKASYWIKGVLAFEKSTRTWIKEADKGIFFPGCSKSLEGLDILVVR